MPERPAVPEPGDRSPAEYAVQIGVPPIDPWSDPGTIHSFYLIRDDLELLRQLLELGVDRLGPLESLLDSEDSISLLSDDQRRSLQARVEGTRAWIMAWRQGRGRPVDRAALERSGAVSSTFINRVATLNERLGGDGQELVEHLADGEIARFHTDKREVLCDWLIDHGYISDRAPLSQAEVRLFVIRATESHLGDTNAASEETQRLIASLESGLIAHACEKPT